SAGQGFFVYSKDSSFSTAVQVVGITTLNPNNSVQAIATGISGLSSGTTYYFRTEFQNSSNGDTQLGPVVSFTTLTTPVTATAATLVTSSSATLNGTVNTNVSAGQGYFVYSKDSSFTTGVQVVGITTLTPNNSIQTVTTGISGLSSGTTYYYRTE